MIKHVSTKQESYVPPPSTGLNNRNLNGDIVIQDNASTDSEKDPYKNIGDNSSSVIDYTFKLKSPGL